MGLPQDWFGGLWWRVCDALLIQEEVVTNYGWLTMQEFTDIVAVSQMTPGPIGINSATYIGYTVTGSVWGSIAATVSVMVPSFCAGAAHLRLLCTHSE